MVGLPFLSQNYNPLCVYASFIHSPVDRHAACFHSTSVVHRAAMHMAVYFHLWDPDSSPFWSTPRSGIAVLVLVLFSMFWGISIPFSIMATQFYISTNNIKGYLFSCFLNCDWQRFHFKVVLWYESIKTSLLTRMSIGWRGPKVAPRVFFWFHFVSYWVSVSV